MQAQILASLEGVPCISKVQECRISPSPSPSGPAGAELPAYDHPMRRHHLHTVSQTLVL